MKKGLTVAFSPLVLHHRLVQGELLLWVVVLEGGRGDGVPDVLDWVQGVILLEVSSIPSYPWFCWVLCRDWSRPVVGWGGRIFPEASLMPLSCSEAPVLVDQSSEAFELLCTPWMIRIPNRALTSAAVVFLLNPGCFTPALLVHLAIFLKSSRGKTSRSTAEADLPGASRKWDLLV